MRRVLGLFVAVVVLVFAICAASAAAATCTWNGSTADWQTTGDWDCMHVPTSSDDVVISSGAPDVTSADASARSLNLSAGSLTVEATRTLAVSANGTSSIASGMTLKGTLTLGDATTWSAGTISLL